MRLTNLLAWLRRPFAWRTIRSTGVWDYSENTATGQRKAVWRGGGYQPPNLNWLRTGDLVIGPDGPYVVRVNETVHWRA